MSWPDLAVNKAVEVGNKNNVTCNVMNYADSVVQLAGQATKQFYDRMGVRSFRSVKKSIQRLEEAVVSCGTPERLEILRSWVLLLKEVDRLKLSQGSGDVSYNSCDGQPRESWRAQFWPNSIKLGNNWPLAPNPLPCVTQRQGPLSLSQQKRLFHVRHSHRWWCSVLYIFSLPLRKDNINYDEDGRC